MAHAARPAANPIVLNGTLTVDNNPSQVSTTENEDGSETTAIPVAGQLGGLGYIHGIWDESVDSFGDYEGPDTITMRNTKGTFVVAFNDENASPSSGEAPWACHLRTHADGPRWRRTLCPSHGDRNSRIDHEQRPDADRHPDFPNQVGVNQPEAVSTSGLSNLGERVHRE